MVYYSQKGKVHKMYGRCTKVNKMLRWDFKKKVGTVTEVLKSRDGNIHKWTYNLYQGNAFLIALAEWTNEENKEVWQMHWFFASKEHMKECLGVGKSKNKTTIFDDRLVKFEFNQNMYKSDLKQLLNSLVQSGIEFEVKYAKQNAD